jgi:hypothetical protein
MSPRGILQNARSVVLDWRNRKIYLVQEEFFSEHMVSLELTSRIERGIYDDERNLNVAPRERRPCRFEPCRVSAVSMLSFAGGDG